MQKCRQRYEKQADASRIAQGLAQALWVKLIPRLVAIAGNGWPWAKNRGAKHSGAKHSGAKDSSAKKIASFALFGAELRLMATVPYLLNAELVCSLDPGAIPSRG